MSKIEKKSEIIDYRTAFDFRKSLNDKQMESSIFNAFFEADTTKEDGTEGSDFQLQGNEIDLFFAAIGDDLKQKFEKWYNNKLDAEKIVSSILSVNSENEYTVYDSKEYTRAIKLINTGNIETILFEVPYENDGSYFVNQITSPYFNNINGSYDKTRTIKEIKKDFNHIRKVLQDLCSHYGIDTSELDKKKFDIVKKVIMPSGAYKKLDEPFFDDNNILLEYVELIRDYRESQEIMNKLNRDNREQMQSAIDKRYAEAIANNEDLTIEVPVMSKTQERWSKFAQEYDGLLEDAKRLYANKPEEIEIIEQEILYIKSHLHDEGNGKIDKPAMQRTGNCWLMAGIKALVVTDFGKEFLERNILKDEEKNLFAIHLQEAENKGLPLPNGDGIFVLTEKEVLESQHGQDGLTSGDGDVAAYALAIEKYLEIINNGNLAEDMEFYTDGNSSCRFFEIVTGEQKNRKARINIGINYKICQNFDNNETRLYEFEQTFKLAQEKNTAITVGYKNHAFSVVGTEGDCILVQESNLSENYKNIFELISGSFPPTYKISRDVFEKKINCCEYFRWK